MTEESSPETVPQANQCWICGSHSKDRSRFESHHVWGRAVSNYVLMLCKRCHHEISFVTFSKSWRDIEAMWFAIQAIMEDRDWRFRWFFLKLMVMAGAKVGDEQKCEEAVKGESNGNP